MPASHRDVLGRFIAECAAAAPDFRWTPPANLHLTIRFLGQVEPDLADAIAGSVADSHPPGFGVRLAELGTFKRGRLARVVWLGVGQGEREIAQLASVVEAECTRAGLEPESRPFNAHLTLARSRGRDGAALPSLPPAPGLDAWRASELVLYRSRPGRGGSVYEPLRTISLR